MVSARKNPASGNAYKLLVGLGNPGATYAHTYHNAGAYCLRLFAEQEKFKHHTRGLFEYYKGYDQILVMPRTFMNQSGEAVARAMQFFRIPLEALLVIHDDFDLALGTVKYAVARGSAGHLGVQSIIETLHTNQFARVRLGVRTIPGRAEELVLRTMTPGAREAIARACYSLAMINST